MGRKIEIKKIEDITKRQVTFSKRRSCLLKKAKEIAITCDVDVLLVAFSPANRLSKFCSQNRIEDILQRYIELPIERKFTHMADIQEKVAKLRQLNHIRGDISKLYFLDKHIENLELQITKSTLELHIVDANIRDYEPGPEEEPPLHQLCWCEKNLQLSLQKIRDRKVELEKQGNMDVHFVAQQITPQQFDTNNWINPYSSSIQGSMYQNWMDEGKRVANSSSHYTYTPSFASSSQSGNIPFSQNQSSSPYIPLQSYQQNIVVDVQQNPPQTFGQSQSQQQNMIVDIQQSSTQIFGQSQAQLTFGESTNNSVMNFWKKNCASTRPVSSPLATTGTHLNNPSDSGLEYAHSNSNSNLSNNNINHIIQQNEHSLFQSDAITPKIHGFNYPREENTMGSNGYFANTTYENDAGDWDDVFLNEAFNGEDF
ncbi:hypothetical protein R3W88_012121 [Solanum pinnatisectum]|uniref:MADS-box domain-containing protein n=1 Tax=Solanum pinnatisectum TaxID=50273 RepID=A0AAV9L9E7_9SOLN|nr:hypothetical protein R3W88_012121 [Solanum pinnatisectum]